MGAAPLSTPFSESGLHASSSTKCDNIKRKTKTIMTAKEQRVNPHDSRDSMFQYTVFDFVQAL
jgi:hypothetical protein